MIQHLHSSDEVTAQGLEHLASCARCQCVLAIEDYTITTFGGTTMPTIQGDPGTPIKPLPNINRVEPHAWCQGTVKHDETFSSRQGDVRVCKHGKVQVRTETYSQRVAGPGTDWWRDLHPGPGTDWWRDLHPVFTPILWRRAKAALEQARG